MKIIENAIGGEIVKNEIRTVSLQYNGFGWDKIKQTVNPPSPNPDDPYVISRINNVVHKEVPDGVIDGVNFIFKLSQTPLHLSEHVYLNGVLQTRGEGYDYVLLNNYIYFIDPPQSQSLIQCSYYAQDRDEIVNESPTGVKDGKNDTFLLKNVPIKGYEYVYLNGVLQKEGPEYDYIIVNNKVVFFYPPQQNSIIRVDYQS